MKKSKLVKVGDPNILRGQNDFNDKGRIYPTSGQSNDFNVRQSEEGEE